MQIKQTKKAILQWLVPSAVFLCIVIVILINFSITSRQEAIDSIEDDFIVKASAYATDLGGEIDTMTKTAVPFAKLMSQRHAELEPFTMPMVQVLMKSAVAYEILIVDENGSGITSNGRKVNITQEIWYDGLNRTEQQYYYTPQDKVNGRNAAVSVIPIQNEDAYMGSIVMYYDLDSFNGMIKKVEYDNENCYLIMDKNGNIMFRNKFDSLFVKGDNFYETLSSANVSADELKRIKLKVNSQLAGNVTASIDQEYRSFVYVPIGIEDWMLVLGVNQSYVDQLVSKYWHRTENIIYKLILAIIVFIGAVVIINVIIRIRSLERSKTLEDKADTDLLTGLNNKIATERKIKEFIEANPNSQSLMFVLDIDNFKKINDTMGHAFGDEVLRTLGLEIKAEFRVSDIIGRSGGDEFTIFLKNLPTDEVITKESNKVARFFKNFKVGEYVKYSATASIGCAVFPRDGADFTSLYKAADKALYKAKKRGKNQLAFFDEGDNTENLDNVSSKDIR